jgi:hypothetical protein
MRKINIFEKECSSWSQFTATIEDTFTFFNYCRYRGQADSNWKLESTLSRALKKQVKDQTSQRSLQVHLNSFKNNLRGRCSFDLQNISEDELWAIGQHFGLYTPLLDWSFSPFIALYFALQGNSDSGKRALWIITEKLITDINNNFFKEPILKFIEPLSNYNHRLVNQQGLLLKLPIESSLDELAEKTNSNYKGALIYKFIFSDNLKDDFLARLNNMNINNLTLFPDYVGAALHSNFLLDINPYMNEKQVEIWTKFEKVNNNKN